MQDKPHMHSVPVLQKGRCDCVWLEVEKGQLVVQQRACLEVPSVGMRTQHGVWNWSDRVIGKGHQDLSKKLLGWAEDCAGWSVQQANLDQLEQVQRRQLRGWDV